MNIASDELPNPFDRLTGVFEAHVTIEGDRSEARSFAKHCEALGVKYVLIALPRGEHTLQPMTATYHHGGFADVRAEVFALARGFSEAGFRVARVKIEATGSNAGLPQTDSAARQTPNNYFEFHLKVELRSQAQIAALLAVVRPFGAHLSRNARSVTPDGVQQRFVTLRAYGVGQPNADAQFRALEAAIRALALPVSHRLREYTVFDSNVDLDAGWLGGVS